MEYKYNAFISYRHAPLDSALARLIQKRLEHYHIPSSVKKETGKTISRVFLDKEELPTSSNLSDDILDALQHSEYLIVICSTNTNESIWVKREIQAFLERHERSKVITVLADGEPGEVIPEPLLFEERQEIGADGLVRTQRVPVEPLSCDFRMKRSKALHEELPRLVASLLGVEYNQLRQRRKVYQMQRVAAASLTALVIMAVFTAYALKQSSRIAAQARELQEEYRQTLINESLYFASESQAALKENDYNAAIEYGLRALPRDLETEPVIPQAKHALVDALGVYRTSATAKDMAFPTATANAGKEELGTCREILLSGDNAWLIGWNSSQLCVWSAETMELKRTLLPPKGQGYSSGMIEFCSENTLFSRKPRLIYGTYQEAVCVDYLTGKTIWRADMSEKVQTACLSADEKQILVCSQNELVLLDTEDGRQLCQIRLNQGEQFEFGFQSALSTDGRYAAVACARLDDADVNQLRSDLWLVDLKKKTVSKLAKNLYDLKVLHFTRNGQLLAASFRGYHFEYTQNNTKTFSPNQCRALLQCYDLKRGKPLWHNTYTYSHVLMSAGIEEFRIPEEEQDSLFFSFSNYCVLLDGADGTLHNTFELRDSIVGLELLSNGFHTYTVSGTMYFSRFLANACGSIPYFNGDAAKVVSNQPYYYVQEQSGEIVRYELEKTDERYESHPVTEGMDLNFYHTAESASYFASMAGGLRQEDATVVLLKKEDIQCRSITLSKAEYTNFSLLGFSEDEDTLYVLEKPSRKEYTVHCISVESGTVQSFLVPAVPADSTNGQKAFEDIICCGSSLILTARMESKVKQGDLSTEVTNRVGVYTWVPGQAPTALVEYELYPTDAVKLKQSNGFVHREIPAAAEHSYCTGSLKANADGRTVFFLVRNRSDQDVRIVRVETESGKVTAVEFHRDTLEANALLDEKLAAWSASGQLCALAWSDEVHVGSSSGAAECSISLSDWDENGLVSVFFTPSEEQLVLLRKDGTLAEYDVQTGELVGEAALSDNTPSAIRPAVSLPVEGETCVMIQTFEGISVFDTDPDTFGECYWLEDAICYWQQQDSFLFWRNPVLLLGESETVNAGIIRRYTAAELKELAEKRLGTGGSDTGKTSP